MTDTFEKSPTSTESQAGDIQPVKESKEAIETRVGQIEVKVDALKERVDGNLELRKWLFIATLTALGIGVAAGTLIFNVWRDSQTSYRDLQNSYYKELIDLRKEMDQKSESLTPKPVQIPKANQ